MMRRSGIFTGRHYFSFRGMVTLLALLLTGLTGCGYKTMPVPPQEIVPTPVTDLRYELNEMGVTLYWTYPGETIKGEKLTDISLFNLYRAVVPADAYCDTCPIPFREPIQIPGGAVTADRPKTATYNATLLRPGHLFFFKVRSKSGWWAESADSNIVSFMWNIPPGVPEKPVDQADDKKVILKWKVVTTHMDGSEIREPVRYQLYRSRGGGPFVPIGDLQDSVEYVDMDVANGRKYLYKVQAVTMYDKGQVGGGFSEAVESIPVDRTPSAVPSGVRAIRTAAEVKVVWNPLQDKDVKGYRIYRRLPGEKKSVKVGEVNVPYSLFADKTPPDAEEWFYSVTSFDNAAPANESEASAEAMVRR